MCFLYPDDIQDVHLGSVRVLNYDTSPIIREDDLKQVQDDVGKYSTQNQFSSPRTPQTTPSKAPNQ